MWLFEFIKNRPDSVFLNIYFTVRELLVPVLQNIRIKVPVSWNLKPLKEPMALVLWKIRIKESPVPVIWKPLKNWWFQFLSILESENHWIQFSEKNQNQRTIDLSYLKALKESVVFMKESAVFLGCLFDFFKFVENHDYILELVHWFFRIVVMDLKNRLDNCWRSVH